MDSKDTKFDITEAFTEYNVLIYRYIYVRCGFHKEVAEDITQETFIKAWNNRDKYDSEKASLKTWLFRIARNLMIDYFRKNKYQTIELDESLIAGDEFISKIEISDDYKKVINSMERLKQKERDLLVLRYVDELEIEEIAQIIKKNNVATKVAIHRALNKLKVEVNEKK